VLILNELKVPLRGNFKVRPKEPNRVLPTTNIPQLFGWFKGQLAEILRGDSEFSCSRSDFGIVDRGDQASDIDLRKIAQLLFRCAL
jgi:hypothetical protein